MAKQNSCNINELLALFEDVLSPADVISSKLMAQISTAITKERLKLKMNQSDFAKHINASQSLISRWEHGDYNFSIRKLSEIAASLDLDVNIYFRNSKVIPNHNESDSISEFSFIRTIGCSISPKKYEGICYTAKTSVKAVHENSKEDYIYASIH